jgi:nicotinate phosphoribosyltransferase
MVDNEDKFIGADAIAMSDEQDLQVMHHPLYPLKSLSLVNMKKQPLLNLVMENGLRLNHAQTISQIASFSKDQLARLPAEFKRFDYPHIYKVGISARLQTARDRLINEFKK